MSTGNQFTRWITPLLLLAVFFWAGSFVVTKVIVTTIPPASIAFLRFAGSTLFILLLLMLTGKLEKPQTRHDVLLFFLLGLFSYFAYFIFINNGIRFTTAANSGLLTATYPIFAALLAFVFLRENFNGYKLVGLITGVAGAVLIVSHGFSFTFSLQTAKGDFLVLAGVALGSFDPIISKKLVSRYRPLTILAYGMLFGSILFFPFFLLELPQWQPAAVPQSAVLGILYLALCPTIIGYFIWYSCLQYLEATHVAFYTNLIPLATVLLAVIILQEHIMSSTIIGSVLVIGGAFCLQQGTTIQTSKEQTENRQIGE